MILVKNKTDLKKVKDLETRRAMEDLYEVCFADLVEEGYSMDRMGMMVVLENRKDIEEGQDCVQLKAGEWEYASLSGNVWHTVNLINDEYGHMFFIRNDIDMPASLRDALEADKAVNEKNPLN